MNNDIYSLISENREQFPDLPINEYLNYAKALHYSEEANEIIDEQRSRAIKILYSFVYSSDEDQKQINDGYSFGEPDNHDRMEIYKKLYEDTPSNDFYLKMRLATVMLYSLCSAHDIIE